MVPITHGAQKGLHVQMARRAAHRAATHAPAELTGIAQWRCLTWGLGMETTMCSTATTSRVLTWCQCFALRATAATPMAEGKWQIGGLWVAEGRQAPKQPEASRPNCRDPNPAEQSPVLQAAPLADCPLLTVLPTVRAQPLPRLTNAANLSHKGLV